MANRIVGWLVLVPLCVLLIAFALANRQLVSVNINPFAAPLDAASSGYGVPLFIVLYAVLLVGVLLGGIATWFAQGVHRSRERHWRREARLLSTELEQQRRAGAQLATGPLSEVDDVLDLR